MAIFIAVDAYIYFAIRKTLQSNKFKKYYLFGFILGAILSYVGVFYMNNNFIEKPLNAELLSNLFVGFFFSFFVFRLVLLFTFLLEDITRILRLSFVFLKNLFSSKDAKSSLPARRKFIRQAGLTVAAIPFTSMIYGVIKGRYDFKVNKINLAFSNLPKAFDGFRIVQISDIHSGSFDSEIAIQEGIELINQQKADVILFTGDLVNNDSKEVAPYIQDFKNLKANEGIYSVLGNHDYGDYKKWDSEADKDDNMQLLYDFQEQMGFQLLKNENIILEREGQQISILGVENWGKKPFPQRGDLDMALSGVETVPFKILMSHDPTHWTKKVLPHQTKFDITLSGHTHGMQFGVEIPGFKWSPIKYLYPQWAGLYEKAEQYLYVNRGFGFLGYPGRAGIRPEISVIELQHKA